MINSQLGAGMLVPFCKFTFVVCFTLYCALVLIEFRASNTGLDQTVKWRIAAWNAIFFKPSFDQCLLIVKHL